MSKKRLSMGFPVFLWMLIFVAFTSVLSHITALADSVTTAPFTEAEETIMMPITSQITETVEGQPQSSGTISAPVTSSPGNDSPTIEPTALMQTREAALDQSHLPGPALESGDAAVTPIVQPQTEAESPERQNRTQFRCLTGPGSSLLWIVTILLGRRLPLKNRESRWSNRH